MIENINACEITTESATREQQKLRRQCLKCCITKAHNGDSLPPDSFTQRQLILLCHSDPFSFPIANDTGHYKWPTIWTNISRYFPSYLDSPLHLEFSFNLALEPPVNTYKLKMYPPLSSTYRVHLPSNGLVTFTNNNVKYPLLSCSLQIQLYVTGTKQQTVKPTAQVEESKRQTSCLFLGEK